MTDHPFDDELDVSEEELRLAAQLGKRLDGGRESAQSKLGSSELESLAAHPALLRAAPHFDLGATQLASGRDDVLLHARQVAARKGSAVRQDTAMRTPWFRRFWIWAPLPAVAVLALIVGVTSPDEARDAFNPRATETAPAEEKAKRADAEDTLPASPPPPVSLAEANSASPVQKGEQYESDQPAARAMLEAQANLLARRAAGQADQLESERWEAAMRDYRSTLLARLEER
jgi:hypothetical protein